MSKHPADGFSGDELRRYGRHLLLPEVGLEGQRKLREGSVLLVGAGGLGSPAGLYLAAAGVGTIGIVDFDRVEESNLQRQIAHGTASLGRLKLDSMRERLADLNPHVKVIPHAVRLDRTNALAIMGEYDVVVDGTDNFPTRYLVNDACVMLRKPNVYGSILRFEGQASVFDATRGPCYRCVFPQPPPPGLVPSCSEAGVLGVLPGVIGSIQATEAIKLLLGAPDTLVGRLILYDAWTLRIRELVLSKDPDCPICGTRPTITELIDYEDFCGMNVEPPLAVGAPGSDQMSPKDLKARRERGEDLVLLDVRELGELALSRLGGETHIPLAMMPLRAAEIEPSRTIVVMCHHGTRSAMAVRWLHEHGYKNLYNLAGGIDAYAREADPAVPRY